MNDSAMTDNTAADLTRLAVAAREALTDNMVERLSTTGANVLEVADRLNDEPTRDAVFYLLDRLTEMHRSGALATLFETVTLLHAAREASTDSIIERLFGFVEHTINTVGSEEFSVLVEDARASLTDAAAEATAAPPKGGMLATLSLLSDPETQRNLRFLMSFSGRLRERTVAGGG